MTDIKHRITGSMLWSDDKPTIKESLEAAVAAGASLDGASLDGASLDGANLARANLYGANLYGANLDGANLDGANLDGASLARASLYGANLDGASLYGANLDGASLARANLYGANLDGASLARANLDGASLARASLYGANLDGANLARANLDGANLDGASLEKLKPLFAVYPQVGVFSAFKKVKAPCGGEAVLLVEIQDGVPRCNALSSRNGRAQSVHVKSLVSGPVAEFYISKTDTDESRAVKYVVGETATAHEWCDDVRVECAPGIHFFLTREEAEAW